MPNNWINHVKKYAAENGISYSCALSHPDCKNSYKKVEKEKVKIMKKSEFLDKIKEWGDEFIRDHKKTKKKMNEEEFERYKRKFNMSGKEFKEYIKDNAPKIYNSLIIPKHKKSED